MPLQPNNFKTKQVAASWYHTLILSNPGYVYGTGKNTNGQLADSIKKSEKGNTLRMIGKCLFGNERITQIACGDYHSVVLSQTGDVYTFGKNEHGQLGLGDYKDRDIPCKIDKEYLNNEKAIKVYCGGNETMIETESGNIYSVGRNDCGNLGIEEKTKKVSNLTLISKKYFDNEKVIEMSVGWNHSIVLTENKRVYSWGHNKCGELGQGDKAHRHKPTEIDLSDVVGENDQVKQVVAGSNFTSILTEEGKVYTCGRNEYGSLGHGDEQDRYKLTCVSEKSFNDEKVVSLSLGKAIHIIACTNKSNVFVWGHNGQGRLGLGDCTDRNKPTQLESELLKKENIAICHYKRREIVCLWK